MFIDAPGTGFSRVLGKDAGHAFWGMDEDAHAFDRFIRRFLTKYDLWNSPKYLFGESYGTTRGALLGEILQDHNVDINGIVELSENITFDNSPEGPPNNPDANPGDEQNYFLTLPAMAATAWYHHYLPNQPTDLESFLREVERFSLGEYASALLQGSDLAEDRKQILAEKLHRYTGIPAAYWIEANLHVSGAQFRKQLETEHGLTIGRLDTRYEGPDLDPLSEEATYDPLSSATNSAFGAAINLYAHETLKYGKDLNYKGGFKFEVQRD